MGTQASAREGAAEGDKWTARRPGGRREASGPAVPTGGTSPFPERGAVSDSGGGASESAGDLGVILSPGERAPEERAGPETERGGASCAGMPLIDPAAIDRCPPMLARMSALFRTTTGLDLHLFCRDATTGQWQEKGIAGAVRTPPYCELIRSVPEGAARCDRSHREMVEHVTQHAHGTCRRCHAGLVTAHLLVSVGGRWIGDIRTPCALHEELSSDTFAWLYKKIADLGLPKKAMFQAAKDLAVFPPSKVEVVLAWFRLIADYLSEISSGDTAQKDADAAALDKLPAKQAALWRLLRQTIGRHIVLPPVTGSVSCGCSESLIQRVADFIDRYYHLPLSTQLVAFGLGFEPSYFGKMFKYHVRESMTKYLKRTRLAQAKKLMENPYLSVAEIARRTGFSDASYFTRVFRNAFGVTPSRFRQLTTERF